MKILVVGGGKVGFYLVKTLVEHGHQPHLVEIDEELCKMIADQMDIPVFRGDGTSIEVLSNAGIAEADAVVATTGRDEDNLIICQLAKKLFGVAKTVGRINNPKNAEAMTKLGVDIPVSSTQYIVRLLEREVNFESIKMLMSVGRGGDLSFIEVTIPKGHWMSGKTLSELSLSEDLVIVAITRDGQSLIPRGNTAIYEGDHLIVIVRENSRVNIEKTFGLH